MRHLVTVTKTKDGSLEFVYKHNDKLSVGICVDNKKDKIEYAKKIIISSIAAIELMGFKTGDEYEDWHINKHADCGDRDIKGMKEKISELVDFEILHEKTKGELAIAKYLDNNI